MTKTIPGSVALLCALMSAVNAEIAALKKEGELRELVKQQTVICPAASTSGGSAASSRELALFKEVN